MNRMKFSSKSI